MLRESDIIYAVNNTNSNAEAARFLRTTAQCWSKYAKMYFEPTTGKTYHEFLKIKRHLKTARKRYNGKLSDIEQILNGLKPTYSKSKLERRLLTEGILPIRCEMCGFSEQNILTKSPPLILECIDGNDTNFLQNNLRFLCYNCAFLTGYKMKLIK